MAYDGSGNYSLPPGSIVSDGTTIDAADHNVPVTDIAAALSQVLLRSGVAPMTGDLDLGGFDVINAGGSGGTFLTEDDIGTSGHKIPYLDQANTWSTSQVFNGFVNAVGGGQIGDNAADPVYIKGVAVSSFSANSLGGADAAAWRASLGLGSAAMFDWGTSGASVPLLNQGNTWSAGQSINAATGSAWLLGLMATDKGSTAAWTSIVFLDGYGYANGSITHLASPMPGTPGGATNYNTSSDERLKYATTPLADSGAIVDQLQPIRFRWGSETGPEDFGLSAQALHAVVPQAVTPGTGEPGQPNFIPWQIEKAAIVPILLAEIKALRARVAALEAALP